MHSVLSVGFEQRTDQINKFTQLMNKKTMELSGRAALRSFFKITIQFYCACWNEVSMLFDKVLKNIHSMQSENCRRKGNSSSSSPTPPPPPSPPMLLSLSSVVVSLSIETCFKSFPHTFICLLCYLESDQYKTVYWILNTVLDLVLLFACCCCFSCSLLHCASINNGLHSIGLYIAIFPINDRKFSRHFVLAGEYKINSLNLSHSSLPCRLFVAHSKRISQCDKFIDFGWLKATSS